jgi:hypothetical protein
MLLLSEPGISYICVCVYSANGVTLLRIRPIQTELFIALTLPLNGSDSYDLQFQSHNYLFVSLQM